MKKKTLLFCLFLIAFSGNSFSKSISEDSTRENSYRNSVYLELGGNGIITSLNYERLFNLSVSQTVAIRLGGFFIPTEKVGNKISYEMVIPAEFTIINGQKKMKFETGFGFTLYGNSVVKSGKNAPDYSFKTYKIIPVFRLGVRWQPFINPALNPVFLRFGFTPLFWGDNSSLMPPVMPWLGVSFGYSFGKK